MRRFYEAPAYETAPDPGNLWRARTPPETMRRAPLEAEIEVDHAIIGAGVTGLSAALRLAEGHGRSVAVLEAAWPGWGASGRAGGFVCLGGAKLSDDAVIRRCGLEEARAFHRFQREAVAWVDAFLTDRGAAAARHGAGAEDGETMLAHRPRIAAGLAAEAARLKDLYGLRAEALSREALIERGVAGPEFHGGLHIPVGFAVDPLAYAQTLLAAAERAGAVVFGDSAASRIAPGAQGVIITTARGAVRAKNVIIAVNGYGWEGGGEGLSGAAAPAFSSVLATRPLTAAEQAEQGWSARGMAFCSRILLHYFRLLPDGRFLFGMRGGVSATPRAQDRARMRLRRDFARMFPAWAAVETPHVWSGLVCLTASFTPFIGALPSDPRLLAAFGYHGNGLAMGGAAGRAAADLAVGALRPEDLPAPLRGPLRRFAAPALRRLGLRAAYLAYALRDGWP
ncbi:MAG: FAD-dependent oxidoreductase [Pseudomonadota bacterium]